MMADMPITAPAATLGGLYALLALLLLALILRSAWSWRVKTSAVLLALPSAVGTFLAVHALTGWPSEAALPGHFQLHAALVEEPVPGQDEAGAIFVWLKPLLEEIEGEDVSPPPMPPRAFALPYSRDLHEKIDAMRERLARGEAVNGRFTAEAGWQRRFDRQRGGIDLEAPPPPSLPRKDEG